MRRTMARQRIEKTVATSADPATVERLLREGATGPPVGGPPGSLSYTEEASRLVKDFRVDIDLIPRYDGTEIRFAAAFAPKLPGTGGLLRRAVEKFMAEDMEDLGAQASREAGATASP